MNKPNRPNDEPARRKPSRAESPSASGPHKSPPGRPKGDYRSAQHEGTPVGAHSPSSGGWQPQRGDDAWSEVANFVVTFEQRSSGAGGSAERRITAHKMQEGGITAEWSGAAQQPMCAWIQDHVGDWGGLVGDDAEAGAAGSIAAGAAPGDAPAAAPTPVQLPAVAQSPLIDRKQEDMTLLFSELRVALQAADADVPASVAARGPDAMSIASDHAFNVEGRIELRGLREPDLRRHAHCSVQFFGRNLATKEGLNLGKVEIESLAEGQTSYQAVLRGVRLPAGHYRLASVALLQGDLHRMAYKAGPLVQIA